MMDKSLQMDCPVCGCDCTQKDRLIAALTEEVENQRQTIQHLFKLLAEAEPEETIREAKG